MDGIGRKQAGGRRWAAAGWAGLALGVLVLWAPAARAQRGGTTPAALVAEAERLTEAGDTAAAVARYRAALRLYERFEPALLGLAHHALARRDWDEAASLADRVLDRDTTDLDANYVVGVADRERARYRTVIQRRFWDGARIHFERVLRRDSLYRDVLYQYALLRRNHEAFEEAIRLAEAQIRLRPELVEPRLGLYRIYRHFAGVSPTEARRRFERGATAYDRLFLAELLRRAGDAEAADARLADLARSPGLLPPSAVLLARARAHFQMGRSTQAQALVDEAVARLDGPLAAGILMEDFKYLLSDAEWADYTRLRDAGEYRGYFRAFWSRRDPMPSRPLNVRLEEYYARMRRAEADYAFFGFKSWFNSPDKLHELDFPAAYRLNEEFNDRGLVYLRHGPPDDRITLVTERTSPNESWRYNQLGLDFHFVVDPNAGGGNWRLTPRLQSRELIAEHAIWGRPYVQVVNAHSELEMVEAEHAIARRSREDALRGLTTESYQWPQALRQLDVPHVVAAFRDAGGGTRLELFYNIPSAELQEAHRAAQDSVRFEAGFALVDPSGRVVAEEQRRHAAVPGSGAGGAGFFKVVVPPDSYAVSVHLHVQGDAPGLGTATTPRRLPDFSTGAFSMSDVLPARLIRPADAPGPLTRGDLFVLPNPSRTFSVREPVFVYYELYDLAQDAGGQTRYAVEINLVPERERRGPLGLFGRRNKPLLGLRTEGTGTTSTSFEHAEIDVSRVEPGTYQLQVVVVDRVGGTEVVRTTPVVLTR